MEEDKTDEKKRIFGECGSSAFRDSCGNADCLSVLCGNGVCDYRKLWIVSGIPFGVQKMYFWMIPKGFDIGGTVGMFAFNLLVGGLIGSMVLTWRLLMAGKYLLKSIGYGGLWIVKKVFRT